MQINNDVFSYWGLGKSSKLILEQLERGPKTIEELEALTGKRKPTVKKWLNKMSKIVDTKTGELLSLVATENGLWFKVEGMELEKIAELLNVAGIQEKRKRMHQIDRELHSESLKIGRKI